MIETAGEVSGMNSPLSTLRPHPPRKSEVHIFFTSGSGLVPGFPGYDPLFTQILKKYARPGIIN